MANGIKNIADLGRGIKLQDLLDETALHSIFNTEQATKLKAFNVLVKDIAAFASGNDATVSFKGPNVSLTFAHDHYGSPFLMG